MKCIGFGEFKNKCENDVGNSRSKWWCTRCDDLRMKHIDKQMRDIIAQMEKDEKKSWEEMMKKNEH